MRRVPVLDRFWAKVRPEPGDRCWLWSGGTCRGYGILSDRTRPGGKKATYAHRFSREIAYGPIPDALCVLHRCDVRNCVNPAHLFLGTRDDNNKDRMRKGRGGSHLIAGEFNKNSKLTETQVREIRERRASGATTVALAAEYGVTTPLISYIVKRRIWKHVP